MPHAPACGGAPGTVSPLLSSTLSGDLSGKAVEGKLNFSYLRLAGLSKKGYFTHKPCWLA